MTKLPRRELPPRLRVLVVEANMIIALDTEDMLRRHGASAVDVAADAAEALRLLAERAYGIALLDLRLPDAGCIAVAERLRELAVPFIFSAGYGEHAENPPAFPAIPLVGKPFSESFLLARLVAMLANGAKKRI